MTAPAPVTFYTRAGCPLCDEARALLEALGERIGFAIEAALVDGDHELRARYGEAVPVVAIGDEEIARAPIRAQALEAALRERYR